MSSIEAKFPPNSPLKTHKIFVGTQIFFRICTFTTTLAAAWIMITNKQSIQIGVFIMDAKYSYSCAFKFFAYANFIVSAFSLLSLLFLSIFGRHGSNPARFFFLFLVDLLMMLLGLAGCSAATAVGYLGKYGNMNSGWMPICDHFERFCHKGTLSLGLAYLSLVFLLMLTIISASKSRQIQV